MFWRRGRNDPPLSSPWRGSGLVILFGHARSGTTVLGRALGSHPAIGYWEEPGLLRRVDWQLRWLRRASRHLMADSSVVDLSEAGRDGSLRDQLVPESEIDSRAADELALRAALAPIDLLRREFLTRSGGDLLLEKTPNELPYVDRVSAWLPDARFIHIVRDARDVVRSGLTWEERWGRPGWAPDDEPLVDGIAKQWSQQVGAAIAELDARSTLLVRYEDFVRRGEEVVARCLAHIGLEPEQAVTRFLERGMGGLHGRSVGAWRDGLDGAQQRRIHEIAGETLRAAGYEVDDAG